MKWSNFWIVLISLVFAPVALTQELNVLVIGSTHSFSEEEIGQSGVVHEKPFDPTAIATHLQGILSQDELITDVTPTVNVVFDDIYFVANTTMDYRTVTGRFRVAEGRVPRFWNAEDGSVTPCHFYEVGEGFVRVELDLPPASSIFVVFAESEPVDHLIQIEERVSGDSEPDNLPAIEVLAMDSKAITTRIWQPGTYSFKTAEGRAGELSLDSVPGDMPITSPWKLNFPADRGAPDQIRLDTLIDWTGHSDPGVRYFSGTARYQNRFVLSSERVADASPVYLDLGAVREVAEITINGKKAGILWKEPYRIDISSLVREGENSLEIAVTNNWINRLIGDAGLEPDTRITRTNISHKIKPDQPLTPSGLVGPVRLRFPVSATIDLE